MFESKVYVNRRRALIEGMAMRLSGDKGIAVFVGAVDALMKLELSSGVEVEIKLN